MNYAVSKISPLVPAYPTASRQSFTPRRTLPTIAPFIFMVNGYECMDTPAPLINCTISPFNVHSFARRHIQITLSVGSGTSGTDSGGSAVSIAYDASAEDMKNAITNLGKESLDGYVGDLLVSRESNGAKGLQAYRWKNRSTISYCHGIVNFKQPIPPFCTPIQALLDMTYNNYQEGY